MQYDDKTIEALANARRSMNAMEIITSLPTEQQLFEIARLVRSFGALDKAGVFAALDEQTDTPAALLLLAASAQGSVNRELAGHPDTVPVDEPLYGDASQMIAARLRENQCPTCNATHFKDAEALQYHIDAAH